MKTWLFVIGAILFFVIVVSIGDGGDKKETSPITQETIESAVQENPELGQIIRRYFETEPGWDEYAKTDEAILIAKYLVVRDLLKEHGDFETAKILLTAPDSSWTLKEIQHYIYLVQMIED